MLGVLSVTAVSYASNTAPVENRPAVEEEMELDPWEPFNAKMFPAPANLP